MQSQNEGIAADDQTIISLKEWQCCRLKIRPGGHGKGVKEAKFSVDNDEEVAEVSHGQMQCVVGIHGNNIYRKIWFWCETWESDTFLMSDGSVIKLYRFCVFGCKYE